MTLKRFIKSFAFALSGFAFAFRSQFNMRFHIFAAVVAIVLSIFLKIDPFEWCVILMCIGSVISAELINTSLEVNIDLVSPGKNEKAGQVKDLAAAAVLVVSVISALIGCIIFIPKIIHLFK